MIPIRVVLHVDPETALTNWRRCAAAGYPYPKPDPVIVKFADNPGGTEFWGIRVDTGREQVEKYPDPSLELVAVDVDNSEGRAAANRPRRATVPYQVFDLSPSTPYHREIDLGRLFDFSKPGEYRVQVFYTSGGNTSGDNTLAEGRFTGPAFTIVIRE